ncbi:hypothetical protein EMIHUDRAFT_243014 [Emiliania huxleyi CCMP1516]|uniref:Major facilitator superfamily (MFS) profile domain-containing protein n=2 Tax=Emiliania huxleyi TaxID=2903 RepID=A0A0D3J701_EMIH1|nr:hypothetical protein EMIHUDRAFT_243014 [Emiliania huxleyi CCMP1516]EOD19286.1 hypothetical protein EMIHUDRAFT_243014 [Emiliania huxleyi CCMP1516]|eukprot:XP_005771715.1 hypothetical protein EMIHUDRAFT_243014 [Emiliania huxleyi CCMP1516]
MRRLQPALWALLVAATGWVMGSVELTQALMTTAGGRFETASGLRSSAFLVSFGLSKAASNLVVGWLADRAGRRTAMAVGWLAGAAVAPMIHFAQAWEVVVASDVLLGIQQSFCWSAGIFAMLDLLGPSRRGLAIGLLETLGYIAIAASRSAIAAAGGSCGEDLALGLAGGVCVAGALVSAACLRETNRPPPPAAPASPAHDSVHLAADGSAGGARGGCCSASAAALAACCVAGCTLNFGTAFAWGAMTRWLTSRECGGGTCAAAAGAGQLPAGAAADRRLPCGAGEEGRAERPPLSGAAVGAAAGLTSLLGLGTALAYANLQACAAPLVPPHRSSSAIGAVRCVRDLGYAVGGVALGAVSDLSGRPWAAPALGAVAAAVAAALFEGARGRAIAAEKAAGGREGVARAAAAEET